jgi:dienelactone hydrolase
MSFLSLTLATCLLLAVSAASEAATPPPNEIPLQDFLVISRVGGFGRAFIQPDAIQAQIVTGKWVSPSEGDQITLPDGQVRAWEKAETGADGSLRVRGFGGAYAYARVDLDAPRVMILDSSGDATVYVNGELHTGDVYSNGYLQFPVALKKGRNDFLFSGMRGGLKAKLVAPEAPVSLNAKDPTTPDFVLGEKIDDWGAVVVINATDQTKRDLSIRSSGEGLSEATSAIPEIPPYSIRKVGFRLKGSSPKKPGDVEVTLRLQEGKSHESLSEATLKLRVRKPDETRKITFISDIDGSVQYYAVRPAVPLPGEKGPLALFLSLHGAGVEAIGQADAYSPKNWGDIVCPTNRRPFGFDWEDWGRIDAMEVLAQAENRLHPDPRRIYLTGHSMGGHGTWQVGAQYAGDFAAIGPSAGWISFDTYGGRGGRLAPNETPPPTDEILQRGRTPSDTFTLSMNYASLGIYILHGEDDDNVPITEAESMVKNLETFHHDFIFHRQPKAGHWWDASDEPGADCVDWADLFDFFSRHSLPADDEVRTVNFVTASPGVTARMHWATILNQIHSLQFSRIDIRWDPGKRRYVGTTENVSRLALDMKAVQPGEPFEVDLDGGKIESIPYPKGDATLYLERQGEKWAVGEKPSPSMKNPARYGPFRDAFNHRMIFVYGTKGSPEENAWAFQKARYDAESFYYRGNGSIDVVPDTEFRADKEPDRNVILYGNATTNAAWKALFGDSPIQVEPGRVKVGDKDASGDDLACLFVRPRPGSDLAEAAAVSGTGISGMRLTDRMSYLSPGAGYPDYVVLGTDALETGDDGVRVAGFFGQDWGIDSGDSAWGK